ncbi:MAG: hypothetical protein AAGG07_10575 [Planctomycetota bacterium]
MDGASTRASPPGTLGHGRCNGSVMLRSHQKAGLSRVATVGVFALVSSMLAACAGHGEVVQRRYHGPLVGNQGSAWELVMADRSGLDAGRRDDELGVRDGQTPAGLTREAYLRTNGERGTDRSSSRPIVIINVEPRGRDGRVRRGGRR